MGSVQLHMYINISSRKETRTPVSARFKPITFFYSWGKYLTVVLHVYTVGRSLRANQQEFITKQFGMVMYKICSIEFWSNFLGLPISNLFYKSTILETHLFLKAGECHVLLVHKLGEV